MGSHAWHRPPGKQASIVVDSHRELDASGGVALGLVILGAAGARNHDVGTGDRGSVGGANGWHGDPEVSAPPIKQREQSGIGVTKGGLLACSSGVGCE